MPEQTANTAAAMTTSSIPLRIPTEQEALYREVLTVLEDQQIPYAVAGAFALQMHTGICRYTKDLDVFLRAEEVPTTLAKLHEHGFECEICDPVWLAKAQRGEFYVDLITGMSNAALVVDISWIQLAHPAIIVDVPTRVLAPEELLASKLFVTRRERFDGADIAHVIHGTRGNLEWDRLLSLAGDHWEVLLWSLLLFRYCYPMHSDYVPRAIWSDLLGRLQGEISNGYRKQPFRGSLIDENMFAIDLKEWGLENILEQYRARREPKITTVP